MTGIRITGGTLRGRLIPSPRLPGTRPLLARVRLALFDTLGGAVRDSDFLDLFAGTGIVGIEALSRGARWATFVESSRLAADTLKEALSRFGFPGTGTVLVADVLNPRAWPPDSDEPKDLVFVGTPYRLLHAAGGPARLARALADLWLEHRVARGARVVIQEEAGGPVVDMAGAAPAWIPAPDPSRTHGRTRLAFWRAP